MKKIWTVLSVMAVANLLALGAFTAWLRSSDRIDMGRVQQVRQLFTETLAQQKAREDDAKAKVDADEKAAAEKAKAGQPPIAAGDLLALKIEQSKADQERLESLQREVQILRETLRRERGQLDADKAKFKTEQEEFDRARQAVVQTEGNAQFKKALATLEGLKPEKAKTTLQQLIDTKQVDQVVAYLNAMQERTRTKVMDEFIKSDPKVATDLLERIRTRGIASRSGERPRMTDPVTGTPSNTGTGMLLLDPDHQAGASAAFKAMLDQRIGDPSNPRDDGNNGPVSRKEDARRRDPSLDPTAAAAAELVSPAIAKPVIAESQAIESGQAPSGPAGQSPARTVSKASSPGEPRAQSSNPTEAQALKAAEMPSAPQAAQAGAAQPTTDRGGRGGKAQESTPVKAQRSAGMPQNQAGASPARVAATPVAARLAGPGGTPSGGSARIAGLNLKSLESKLAPKADRPQPRFKLEQEDEKVAAQFGRGLAAALRQNGGSVTIRLQPEALGDLKIKMSLDSGKVGASFEVQTDQARQLLGKSLDTLKSALEARGLEVGRLDVQVADHGHASDIAVDQHAGGASADPGSGGGGGSEHPEPRTARTAWMPQETAEPAEQSGPWMGSGTGGALRIRLDALA